MDIAVLAEALYRRDAARFNDYRGPFDHLPAPVREEYTREAQQIADEVRRAEFWPLIDTPSPN